MSEPDDTALVQAARAGDEAALAGLLRRHRARMKAVAVAMLGHSPDTEDAVQDACVTAVVRLGDLRDPSAAGAWLAAIVANICRGRLRRPVREVSDDLLLEQLHTNVDPVAQAIEQAALRDWVWTALGRLSEPLRLAVVLRYFTGANSYAAIAGICGVPVGTVRSRLAAARTQLADELLATAATEWDDWDLLQSHSRDFAAAMGNFERTGDREPLVDFIAPDVQYTMADGVQRSGMDGYLSELATGLEDGVWAQQLGLTAGARIAVVEMRLLGPPEYQLHCPEGLTEVHIHDGQRTHRILTRYAAS